MLVELALELALDGIETDDLSIHFPDDLPELNTDHIVNLATGFQNWLCKRAELYDS